MAKEKPKSSIGFIILLSILAAIGGFLFGYDTGVISGAMILLVQEFSDLTPLWQELIVSVTVGAAAIFALIGGYATDRFGRKSVILLSSGIFSMGAIIMSAANGRVMLLVGRFTVGAAIGLTSMTSPMYIAESAPTHLRGRLVSMNNLFITFGQFIASVIAGGFSYAPHGWRYMLGLACVPSLIQLTGFLFMPESPRWLIKNDKHVIAQQALERIYGSSDSAEREFAVIKHSFDEEREEKGGNVFLKMISKAHLRRTLILGCSLQLFQQITGINTIMYYSATIIKMAGVKDPHEEIWLAAAVAFVNFACSFSGIYLVERIGRRLLTLISSAGITLALLLLAIGFQLMALRSPAITANNTFTPRYWPKSQCDMASSCDHCIRMDSCGFCFNDSSIPINGSCLQFNKTSQSIYGPCHTHLNTNSAITWATNWCPTDYAWLIVLGLVFYLFCFAPGMGPMPWTINAEIYPQWARGTGNACSTATNWIANLIVSMTFLSLLQGITKQGAYYLYTSLSVVGLIFFWWVLPETKGKTLEEVESLFSRPWFCGRNKLDHRDSFEYVSIGTLLASLSSLSSESGDQNE